MSKLVEMASTILLKFGELYAVSIKFILMIGLLKIPYRLIMKLSSQISQYK